jgi:hypothetical protein
MHPMQDCQIFKANIIGAKGRINWINSNSVISGDFNITLLIMKRSSGTKKSLRNIRVVPYYRVNRPNRHL